MQDPKTAQPRPGQAPAHEAIETHEKTNGNGTAANAYREYADKKKDELLEEIASLRSKTEEVANAQK